MKFIFLLGATQAIYLYNMNGQKIYGEPKYFHAGEHGQLGAKEYVRVVPARFATDEDDIFMRSMIQNYALEEKDKDDMPTG